MILCDLVVLQDPVKRPSADQILDQPIVSCSRQYVCGKAKAHDCLSLVKAHGVVDVCSVCNRNEKVFLQFTACLVFLQGAGGTSGLAQLCDEEAKVSGVLLGLGVHARSQPAMRSPRSGPLSFLER